MGKRKKPLAARGFWARHREQALRRKLDRSERDLAKARAELAPLDEFLAENEGDPGATEACEAVRTRRAELEELLAPYDEAIARTRALLEEG